MLIRAVAGRRVRHPETGDLVTDEPMHVDETAFWWRRVADGDVELVTQSTDPAKKPKAS